MKNKLLMNTFSLDSKNSQIAFKLNAVESYLHIDTISIILFDSTDNEWMNLVSKLELTAELIYWVYTDSIAKYPDTRSISIPITVDPNQAQPIFKIKRTIQNEMLTVGINAEKKCYSTLKLELKETGIIPQKYEVRFEVMLYEMDNAPNNFQNF